MAAADVVALNGALLRIPIDLVEPGPNARGDVGDVDELAASLRAIGQLVPVLVEPLDGGRFRLLDGHRRRAAAAKAGIAHLTAVVRSADDSTLRRTVRQLSIQSHALPFDPMAEAKALHSLMFEQKLTREEIARLVGKSPAWVRDRISLVHLEPDEQRSVERGRLSVAEALLRLKNRREMRDHGGHRPTVQERQGRGNRQVPHFSREHPLATSVAERCDNAGHGDRTTLGRVGCPQCWEAAIRADERGRVTEGGPNGR